MAAAAPCSSLSTLTTTTTTTTTTTAASDATGLAISVSGLAVTPPSPTSSSATSSSPPSPKSAVDSRPQADRRVTEPLTRLNKPTMPYSYSNKDPSRPKLPFQRGHLRSQSAIGPHNTLPMTRTRSLPSEKTIPITLSPAYSPVRPSSPLRPSSSSSSSTARSSLRRSFDDGQPSVSTSMPPYSDAIEIIAEDSELDLTPGAAPVVSPATLHSNTFPRASAGRRRPSSPLVNQAAVFAPQSPSTSAAATFGSGPPPPSPSAQMTRFDEPFPGRLSFSNSSSIPTTPTSFRSRSPSISSLDTIPDTPDVVEAEAEAEAESLARLKAAADAADAAEAESERKSSGRFASFGRDKRKRWSVCGAERRGDLEMETIWED